jgi:predicted RNA binding protein YcfA (HicA-like mRNA interferase family)
LTYQCHDRSWLRSEKHGFAVIRIAGSHCQLFNERTSRSTAVPYSRRDLPRGTLLAIIHQAVLSRDEFIDLL